MAERRMFSNTVLESDAFLDMSFSAQALYIHLSTHADDDGFVNNPKKIQKMLGCSAKDMRTLIEANFIIPFESGVIAITHWKINNHIRSDRYKPTAYQDEKALLRENAMKAYERTDGIAKMNASWGQTDTACIPKSDQRVPCGNRSVVRRDTQYRLGKDSIEKNSIGEVRIGEDRIEARGTGAAEEGKSVDEGVEDDSSEPKGNQPTNENRPNREDKEEVCEEPDEKPVAFLPLTNGESYEIYWSQVDTWTLEYSGVDIMSEIDKMVAWAEKKSCKINPENVCNFIRNWLKDAEAKAKRRPGSFQPPAPGFDYDEFFEAARLRSEEAMSSTED